MSNVPITLDWVKELALCSIPQVFKQLRLDVEEDVQAINGAKGLGSNNCFDVVDNSAGNVFTVFQRNRGTEREVMFMRGDEEIKIAHRSGTSFTVTLTLNNEGRCKLRVNEAELEQWQVRKMALEDIFFGVDS
jgi:hypothetical protein